MADGFFSTYLIDERVRDRDGGIWCERLMEKNRSVYLIDLLGVFTKLMNVFFI